MNNTQIMFICISAAILLATLFTFIHWNSSKSEIKLEPMKYQDTPPVPSIADISKVLMATTVSHLLLLAQILGIEIKYTTKQCNYSLKYSPLTKRIVLSFNDKDNYIRLAIELSKYICESRYISIENNLIDICGALIYLTVFPSPNGTDPSIELIESAIKQELCKYDPIIDTDCLNETLCVSIAPYDWKKTNSDPVNPNLSIWVAKINTVSCKDIDSILVELDDDTSSYFNSNTNIKTWKYRIGSDKHGLVIIVYTLNGYDIDQNICLHITKK